MRCIYYIRKPREAIIMNDKLPSAKELKKIQDELIDTIITKPNELRKMIEIQLKSREGFYKYTIHNLILADFQLHNRTGEGIELLAPYKVWEEKGRHVRKGEKSLRILAPVFKKETNEKTGEETEKLAYFMRVPVFDLSQTSGKLLETDFTHGNDLKFTLEEIINRGNIKVNLSNKQLTRGYTDGKQIWVSKHWSTEHQICTYFHELAHTILHFDKNRNELDSATKELEAEAISYIVSCYLGIENDESPAYILHWTKTYEEKERQELLKGKGSKVLRTAQKILNDLKLESLLDNKIELTDNNEVGISTEGE